MSPSGPNYPSSASDTGTASNGVAATAWVNPSNAEVSDGVYATNTWISGGGASNGLELTGFGFNIPSTAIIDGIYLEFQRQGSAAATNQVNLVKAGTIVTASAKAGTDGWPSVGNEAWVGYGSPTDLWGTTWTYSDINNANFGAVIYAFNTHGGGEGYVDSVRITVYWHTAPAEVPTRYIYKTYNANGEYIGNLPNVKSEFNPTQEINTGGSQITIECGISADTSGQAIDDLLDESGNILTDENSNPLTPESVLPVVGLGAGPTTSLIRDGNRIVVWEYCYYAPNGRIRFQGTIERWEANFGGDTQDESIKILCYSDGSDLDNYMLLGAPFSYTTDQSQTSENASETISYASKGGAFVADGQTFTVGGAVTNLGAISLFLNGNANVTVNIYSDPTLTTLLASVTQSVNVVNPTEILFGIAVPITVVPGTQYFFTVGVDAGQSILIYYQNSNVYSGGNYYQASYAGGGGSTAYVINTGRDLYFKTSSSNGNTIATFSAQDPSTGILAAFMANYQQRGGSIKTTSSSIQSTGLSVPYQFNTNTVYEGIQAMLAVSPNGFYYYVDPATDTLYFQQASQTADVLLTKGVHPSRLTIIATIENIYNVIYFSGGLVGSTNLYKSFNDATSIGLYGPKLERLTDNRVTDSGTASAIGNTALAANKNEQFQTTVTIPTRQMDIATLHVGLIVGFRGYGTFVDSLLCQIVRIDFTPETATLTLGILPPRTIIDLEQITRNLLGQETITNPTAPS